MKKRSSAKRDYYWGDSLLAGDEYLPLLVIFIPGFLLIIAFLIITVVNGAG